MRLLAVAVIALAAAGCASSGAGPRPFPGQPPASSAATGPRPAGLSEEVVRAALSLRGTPYRNGGSTPGGFDCSGFVWYVFGQEGVALPRTVAEQWRVGRTVRRDRLEPGDLVFFDTGGRPASHVGIAVDGDSFVHAPSSRGEVRVERISSSYWSRRYVGGRRLY